MRMTQFLLEKRDNKRKMFLRTEDRGCHGWEELAAYRTIT
jgi:hypothetical protein